MHTSAGILEHVLPGSDRSRSLIRTFEHIETSIEALSSRSSCFNLAAQRLLIECQDLTQDLNEHHKNAFAIELTLCELSAANDKGPSTCSNIPYTSDALSCIASFKNNPQWYDAISDR